MKTSDGKINRCLLTDFMKAAAPVHPENFAHCLIDVQGRFCNPDHDFWSDQNRGTAKTQRIAKHIALIAPLFRAAAIPTFIIYTDAHLSQNEFDIKNTLYKIKPAAGDVLIPKNYDSAFAGSNIDKELKARNIKNLLISGFNLNACVYQTVLDGLENGYRICIMGDCVGNDGSIYRKDTRAKIKHLIQQGVVVARSDAVLKAFHTS